MSRQLTPAWKTPDGRYFDSKEDALIIMCTETVRHQLRQVVPQLIPVAEILCQYSDELTTILISYQNDIRAVGTQSQPIPEIKDDAGLLGSETARNDYAD